MIKVPMEKEREKQAIKYGQSEWWKVNLTMIKVPNIIFIKCF